MSARDEWSDLDPRWLPETVAAPERVAAASLVNISEADALDVELWCVGRRRGVAATGERLVAMIGDGYFRVMRVGALPWKGSWLLRFETFEEPPAVARRRRAGPLLALPLEFAPAIGAALLKFRTICRDGDTEGAGEGLPS